MTCLKSVHKLIIRSADDTVNVNVIKELLYVRCGYMQLSILNSDEVDCILIVLCT